MIFKNLQKKLLSFRNLQHIRGFTLFEMLVVISVIGILYMIVFGSVSDSKAKGRDTKRIADIGVIQLALERYYDDTENKKYPDSLNTLLDYDKSVPTKDTLNDEYKYVVTTNSKLNATCNNTTVLCHYYHLGATLELTNNVLDGDADKNSLTVSGFDGVDTGLMYDVVPKF